MSRFDETLEEIWSLEDRKNFLIDSMDKRVKELFRDSGVEVFEVKIKKNGFTCMSKATSFEVQTLEQIKKSFEGYRISMDYIECNKTKFIFKK